MSTPESHGARDPQRTWRMAAAVRAGETMTAVGRREGVSRERVRQIVRAAGVPSQIGQREERACERCGKRTEVHPNNPIRFCSRACRGMAQRTPDEVLLGALGALARELGRTPTSVDLESSPGTPSPSSYIRAFGSLRAAQIAAGLVPNRRPGEPYRHVITAYHNQRAAMRRAVERADALRKMGATVTMDDLDDLVAELRAALAESEARP